MTRPTQGWLLCPIEGNSFLKGKKETTSKGLWFYNVDLYNLNDSSWKDLLWQFWKSQSYVRGRSMLSKINSDEDMLTTRITVQLVSSLTRFLAKKYQEIFLFSLIIEHCIIGETFFITLSPHCRCFL